VAPGSDHAACQIDQRLSEGRQVRTAALEELTVLIHMVLPENLSKRHRENVMPELADGGQTSLPSIRSAG
jgi:hypothetical protein